MLRDIWDKTWKDKDGKIVLMQFPNMPLFAWAGFTFGALLLNGKVSDVLSWLGSISLIIWGLLELFKGVNYFRRILGLVILVFATRTLLKNLQII